MGKLGKLERVDDLRTIWPNEAQHFTKWLTEEENLALLSDTVGIDIVLEERESPVGDFSADIYASEEGTGRKIIIENQLEDTNHDHLGKIITYASGKNAEVVIWIVKRARDEHRQAVEWLNQHTDEKIGFFLLEIELWKIDDSSPAPKFNVVERPNDWAKEIKASEGMSETKQLQLHFWKAFNDYAFAQEAFRKVFSQRKAQPQHWCDLGVRKAHSFIQLSVNTQKKVIRASIYVHDEPNLYDRYVSKKDYIESKVGKGIEYSLGKKDGRIIVSFNGDMKKDQSEWNAYFQWLCAMSLTLYDVIHEVDV